MKKEEFEKEIEGMDDDSLIVLYGECVAESEVCRNAYNTTGVNLLKAVTREHTHKANVVHGEILKRIRG